MPLRGSVRLFAAVEPPHEVAVRLSSWARSVAAAAPTRDTIRVLDPAALHLTLAFLGEQPVSLIDELLAALAGAAGGPGPLRIELGAPVWLPPRRPRALAVEARESTGALAALQRDASEELWRIVGEPAPRGRFRPHVTVARSRVAVAGPLPPSPQLTFRIWEVALYRSRLDPGGARYERLGEASLVGPELCAHPLRAGRRLSSRRRHRVRTRCSFHSQSMLLRRGRHS
jgi:2'-5' RNA ligase